jgi:uncharacterized iron-regulated membrane protein
MNSRRILFQIHLWIGVALGSYIAFISLTGSAIVLRRELDRTFCGQTLTGQPACEPAFVTWLVELHDHLLGGHAGLVVNGIGAILILVTCISGVVLWWPGRQRWWPRMTIRLNSRGPRFLRELHNVVGVWLFALVFVWALTGVYFAFPTIFHGLSDLARGSASDTAASRFIEDSIAWLVRLHFGRAFGFPVKVTWVILGLAPSILFVTGLLMWWRRRAPRPSRVRTATNSTP